jgi:hypothetical protein
MGRLETIAKCYDGIYREWQDLHIPNTPLRQLFSAAGIMRTYFKETGLSFDHGLSDALKGKVLQTFYGGRSELRWRLTETQIVYCDTKSMFPAIYTLCDLDRFLLAERIETVDCTRDVRELLAETCRDDWQCREKWREPFAAGSMATIVKILPSDDILPVRVDYGYNPFQVADNYLKSNKTLWFTLAHAVVSKLRTGKAPQIVEAIGFRPIGTQKLRKITIAGSSIDVADGGLFKTLVEMRDRCKAELKLLRQTGQGKERTAVIERLSLREKMLKLWCNAGSFGNFL